MTTNAQTVEALWSTFDRFEFEAVAPQSGERIRGRDNFIAVNRHYPGQWRINIVRLIACGDEVITEITTTYGDQRARAVSFFQLKDGKILSTREFWPDPMEAQDRRAQWVERI